MALALLSFDDLTDGLHVDIIDTAAMTDIETIAISSKR